MDDRRKLIEKIINSFYEVRQIIASEMNVLFEKQNITQTQWFVLNIIKNNESISIKSLAGMLGITSSAATQIVNGLVIKGLLSRKRNPRDRRTIKIGLAEKTFDQFETIKNKRSDALSSLFAVLDISELKKFHEIISKIESSNSVERTHLKKIRQAKIRQVK